MIRRLDTPALVLLGLSVFVPPVRATVMTFDPLPADFAEYSTYAENGITLFAQNGSPSHFHADFNPDNSTTGASLFSSDGTPQEIVSNNGLSLFSLISIDVWDIDAASGPVTFTSSSGAIQLVDTTGTILFGAGFHDVQFVRIDLPDPANDRLLGIDNINVILPNAAVPEPSSATVFLGAAISCAAFRSRRRA